MSETNGNREYRDSVFTSYFSDEAKLLEMYNAVSGRDYGADARIEINTLENVLFRDKVNDVSFTIDGRWVVLVEHQSTLNENMPLRLLLYISKVYEKIVDYEAAYRRRLVRIPRPEFIVLYNGAEECPDKRVLRLSDAFEDVGMFGDAPARLELVVDMYNISRRVPRAKALHSWQTSYQRFASRIGLGLSIRGVILRCSGAAARCATTRRSPRRCGRDWPAGCRLPTPSKKLSDTARNMVS
jgi:hypothetical protein